MEINFKTCTVEEMWKFVGSHLESRGFDVILVGGAVVKKVKTFLQKHHREEVFNEFKEAMKP